jgi:hypothetical protein
VQHTGKEPGGDRGKPTEAARLSNFTPQQIVAAHQYLYYVLQAPVWSDYDYDRYCRQHGVEGGGGSDCADHYSEEIRALAMRYKSFRPV